MIGTPGFIGERLEQARKAKGMTAVAVAETLEIKSANVTQYEHGKQSPSSDVFSRMIERLNRPRDFFFKPVIKHDNGGVCYRSISAATKTARMNAEVKLVWLKEIVRYLRKYVEFPAVNIPSYNLPANVEDISFELIEEIAIQCRDFWSLGDGPLPDVTLILENSGIILARIELGAETLDAFSQWPQDEETPYIVLGSDKSSAVRSRFDAAHELGHLILHRHIERRAISSVRIHSLMEQQCHRFAAAFILPESGFSRELWSPTLDGFHALKPRWKASIALMIKRSEELGLLRGEQAKRGWINLARRGWRKDEPLDDKLLPEQPRLLRRSIQLLVDSHLKTRQQILQDLAMNASDVESLTCLDRGFFSISADKAMPLLKVAPTGPKLVPFRSKQA